MTYLESAIIGYWRQGATVQEIMEVSGSSWFYISFTIANYFKNKELW